ncbi:hypothetical protein GCM10020331_102350 [Ectobacillus funiculus]
MYSVFLAAILFNDSIVVRIIGFTLIVMWVSAPFVIKWLNEPFSTGSYYFFSDDEREELTNLAQEIWAFFMKITLLKKRELAAA